MRVDRKKRMSQVYQPEMLKNEEDVIIQNVVYVDENGKLRSEKKKIVDNTSEMITSRPPYVDKIEYMKQYGTLNDMKEITYGCARSSEADQIIARNLRDILSKNVKIVENNVQVKNEE